MVLPIWCILKASSWQVLLDIVPYRVFSLLWKSSEGVSTISLASKIALEEVVEQARESWISEEGYAWSGNTLKASKRRNLWLDLKEPKPDRARNSKNL